MPEPKLPTYKELLWPTLIALSSTLHGSGTKADIEQEVIASTGITDEQMEVVYPENATAHGPKVLHRIAFALSSLKAIGALDNPTRGVWILTQEGRAFVTRGEDAVIDADRDYRRMLAERRKLAQGPDATSATGDGDEEDLADVTLEDDPDDWKRELLEVILDMKAPAFEKLCVALVRAEGCTNVKPTPVSGDGGVDGTGVLEVGLLSFPIYFQAKKYEGSVGPDKVREFRGALAGRGNKGIFITSGTFTAGARAEAERAGAPIDLVDGLRLCELLRKHNLGIRERPTVDPAFFRQFED